MYGSNNLPSILQSISNANSAPEKVKHHTIRIGKCTLHGMELAYISFKHGKPICSVSMYAMCCTWSPSDELYDIQGQCFPWHIIYTVIILVLYLKPTTFMHTLYMVK
jgi:hypothetical protein